jgi:hypothetical protein
LLALFGDAKPHLLLPKAQTTGGGPLSTVVFDPATPALELGVLGETLAA